MRKFTAVLASGLMLAAGPGASAFASPLWDSDDVMAEDSHGPVHVVGPNDRPEQAATIEVDGDTRLDPGEPGNLTITVTNLSEGTDLASWELGIGVEGISDLDDVDILDGDTDLTEASDAELDADEGIVYILGVGNPVVAVGEELVLEYEVKFKESGRFTGHAYVVDRGLTLDVPANYPQFYPYYDENGGTNEELDPMKVRNRGLVGNDTKNYECSLNRQRGYSDGASVRGDNYVQCRDLDTNEIFYEHYVQYVWEDDPLYATAGARNSVEASDGARLLNLNVTYGGTTHSIDVSDLQRVNEWVGLW